MRRVTWQCSALPSLLSARSDRGSRIRLQMAETWIQAPVGGERQRRRAVAANRQQRSDAAEARNTDVNCVDSSFGEWPRADRIWFNWRRLPGAEPSTRHSVRMTAPERLASPDISSAGALPSGFPRIAPVSAGISFAADQSGQKCFNRVGDSSV